MCELISCDKRGKGRLHISETFPTFLIELRQDYLQQALTYQFFLRAWVSVSLVPRRSLLIRCLREVSVTSQLIVESRNDQAENAWGLG